MEVENKLELFNPWKVENIDQFLYYCCPECDTKQKTKSDFIIHAIDAHPGSREYLPLFYFSRRFLVILVLLQLALFSDSSFSSVGAF